MPLIPDSIVGHEKQCGQLLSDIASGNVSHAYLFTGDKHLGKMTTALWFAHLLLSDHLSPEKKPLIKKDMERFIHPDFLCLDDLWIEGVQEDWATITKSSNAPQHHRSKTPTAKSDVISIDDIRALSDLLHETSNSPYFVCIIRGVERMQAPAATAFLKILEEPPKRVVFLLTTDHVNSLLPTLLSRTRVLRFSPLTRKQLKPLLKDEEEGEADFALHIAKGAPGMLVHLQSDPELLRTHRQLHAQARQFWQSTSLKDRLSWLMNVAEKKGNDDNILLHLGLTLREHADPRFRAQATREYTEMCRHLETNAHRGLLLERFVLSIDTFSC
jgi:hypothetical protein